jgi:hypothetical protein
VPPTASHAIGNELCHWQLAASALAIVSFPTEIDTTSLTFTPLRLTIKLAPKGLQIYNSLAKLLCQGFFSGLETVPNWWVNGKLHGSTEILQSLCSFRMTSNELVILSEAKNVDTAPTHQIGTDSPVSMVSLQQISDLPGTNPGVWFPLWLNAWLFRRRLSTGPVPQRRSPP